MQPVQVVRTPGGGGANGVDGGDGGATPEPTFRTCRVPSRLASSQLDTVAAISLPMHSCTVGSHSQLQALARPAPSAPWKLLLHIASEWLYDGPPVLLSPGERLHEGISQAQLEHEVQTRPGERRGTIMLYWRGAMTRSGGGRVQAASRCCGLLEEENAPKTEEVVTLPAYNNRGGGEGKGVKNCKNAKTVCRVKQIVVLAGLIRL